MQAHYIECFINDLHQLYHPLHTLIHCIIPFYTSKFHQPVQSYYAHQQIGSSFIYTSTWYHPVHTQSHRITVTYTSTLYHPGHTLTLYFIQYIHQYSLSSSTYTNIVYHPVHTITSYHLVRTLAHCVIQYISWYISTLSIYMYNCTLYYPVHMLQNCIILYIDQHTTKDIHQLIVSPRKNTRILPLHICPHYMYVGPYIAQYVL